MSYIIYAVHYFLSFGTFRDEGVPIINNERFVNIASCKGLCEKSHRWVTIEKFVVDLWGLICYKIWLAFYVTFNGHI